MSRAQITVEQWNAIREFAMSAIHELEDDLVRCPEDFDPGDTEFANKQLDLARSAIQEINAGAVDLVLERTP